MNWKTHKYLIQKFLEFDKKYFGSRLCKETAQVGWGIIQGTHAGEYFWPEENGDPHLILINPLLKSLGCQNYALTTLLHEMVHFDLWLKRRRQCGHGKLFQTEMKRLAEAGAFKGLW